MSKLPLLLSVPHAGLEVPSEVEPICRLTREDIIKDGDEQAAEVYALREEVTAFVDSGIARAIVDLNRAEDDRRTDGVVKTETCWGVPVYTQELPERTVQDLLTKYHRPYHILLGKLADTAKLGIDCHTMAAVGPPIGPMPNEERPHVCISNGHNETCPADWIDTMAACLRESFHDEVRVNFPFVGGYIVRTHARELPWMQLELSRGDFMTAQEKKAAVLGAMRKFCDRMGWD